MSEKFDSPLILDIGVSHAFAWVMTVLHIGAMLMACLLPISIMIRLGLLALLIASVVHILRTHAWRRSPRAIRKVVFEDDGDWVLERRNEESLGPCHLCSRFVHPWLVILQLRGPQGRLPISLVVAVDAVNNDAFRRLRARLNSLSVTA